MKKLKIIIMLQSIVIIWFGWTIIRVENNRYAYEVGMCTEFSKPEQSVEKYECIEKTETRTSDIWHLLYALRIL